MKNRKRNQRRKAARTYDKFIGKVKRSGIKYKTKEKKLEFLRDVIHEHGTSLDWILFRRVSWLFRIRHRVYPLHSEDGVFLGFQFRGRKVFVGRG